VQAAEAGGEAALLGTSVYWSPSARRDRQPVGDDQQAAVAIGGHVQASPRHRAGQQVADRRRGVDQPDVRVRLREVAEQRAGLGSTSSENKRADCVATMRQNTAIASSSLPASASASAHQNEQMLNAVVVAPRSSGCGSAASSALDQVPS